MVRRPRPRGFCCVAGGDGGVKIGEGRGPLLKKGPSPLPKPLPSPPKTFDVIESLFHGMGGIPRWARAEGVEGGKRPGDREEELGEEMSVCGRGIKAEWDFSKRLCHRK